MGKIPLYRKFFWYSVLTIANRIYQKQGLISNDDLLYTLALFAIEPWRWIDQFEWRTLTDMEVCAL